MKSLLLISTLASSLLLANTALADRDHHHYKKHKNHRSYEVVEYTEYARVVSSRPIYRTVAVEVPVDSCHVETVAYSERRGGDSFKGTVVGGLIGAAIGKEIGNSGGATAAGGLIGAAIGNDIGSDSRRVTRYEDREVCSTRYRTEYERQLVGYDVTYRYDDRIYHTETRQHPGARIVHVRGRH
ncbi:hypothetical protein [Cellvibrio sp. NN19]|uniref:glycine zipper 2TM domain-containing protein n=1 Tax=Cellvibrio chitinivorans TaxID=3102792 RepID=UPI002B403938|nr:hypothetical protein [Cellvibrio sp. NN19]